MGIGRAGMPALVRLLHHSGFRDGDDKPSPQATIFCLLLQDFLFKIPGQQQDKIRAFFQELLGRHDLNMHSRSKPPLLERTLVSNEFNRLRTKLEKLEQRTCFGRSPIAGNSFAFGLQLLEQTSQSSLSLESLCCKVLEGLDSIQSNTFLQIENLTHAGPNPRFLFPLNK